MNSQRTHVVGLAWLGLAACTAISGCGRGGDAAAVDARAAPFDSAAADFDSVGTLPDTSARVLPDTSGMQGQQPRTALVPHSTNG